MSFVVPNDPWLLTAVFTILNMACLVALAVVHKLTNARASMREKLFMDEIDNKIVLLLVRLESIVAKNQEEVKEKTVVPEPDPLANVPEDKIRLWVDMGLLGADGKGTEKQIENLKKSELLLPCLQKSVEPPKPKKKKEPEKPETTNVPAESEGEPKESGSSIMEGLTRLKTD